MIRTALSIAASFAALGLGLTTVFLAAANRERSAELDRWQRWSEIFARQNEAARAALERQEWELLVPGGALGVDGAEHAASFEGATP